MPRLIATHCCVLYCQVSIVEELLPDSFYSDNMNSLLAELDLFDELLRCAPFVVLPTPA